MACVFVLLALSGALWAQAPSQHLSGVVQKVDPGSLRLELSEGPAVTVRITAKTKLLRNGQPIRHSDLKEGDSLEVDAQQDEKGVYVALVVKLLPEDPDAPPRLRRGPQPRRARTEREPATGAAIPAAGKTPEAAPPPAPVSQPRDPHEELVERAKQESEAFSEKLPNYVCKQVTARYQSRARPVNWQAEDVVTAAVVYEQGKESYRNIAINGKETNRKMEELPGSWSTGEFASVLRALFSPGSAAKFRYTKESATSGLSASVYDFEVAKEDSGWNVMSPPQSITPAYRGSVWIDKQSARVLRIEQQAVRLPETFPLNIVESTVDYEFVLLGTEKYLLPVHSETLACGRDSSICSRNVIDFRNYHKFFGESKITFEKP